MKDLQTRRNIKSRKPKFTMQNSGRIKRLDGKWRKPKGIDSKLRLRYAKRKMVSPGYGSPSTVKGLSREGKEEVLVFNVQDLEGLKGVSIVIAAAVGTRKRVQIVKKAAEMKLKVSNLDADAFLKAVEEKLQKKEKKEEKKTQKKGEKVEKKEDSIEDKLSEEDKKKAEKKEIDRLLTKKF